MKATKQNMQFIAITTILAALMLAVCLMPQTKAICQASDVYSLLSPELINFYETEIAGEKVVSKKAEKQIEKTAKLLDISVQKAKTLIILQDFVTRMGDSASLNSLAQMSDMKLIVYAKAYIDKYIDTLTPERKDFLLEQVKLLIKKDVIDTSFCFVDCYLSFENVPCYPYILPSVFSYCRDCFGKRL